MMSEEKNELKRKEVQIYVCTFTSSQFLHCTARHRSSKYWVVLEHLEVLQNQRRLLTLQDLCRQETVVFGLVCRAVPCRAVTFSNYGRRGLIFLCILPEERREIRGDLNQVEVAWNHYCYKFISWNRRQKLKNFAELIIRRLFKNSHSISYCIVSNDWLY